MGPIINMKRFLRFNQSAGPKPFGQAPQGPAHRWNAKSMSGENSFFNLNFCFTISNVTFNFLVSSSTMCIRKTASRSFPANIFLFPVQKKRRTKYTEEAPPQLKKPKIIRTLNSRLRSILCNKKCHILCQCQFPLSFYSVGKCIRRPSTENEQKHCCTALLNLLFSQRTYHINMASQVRSKSERTRRK